MADSNEHDGSRSHGWDCPWHFLQMLAWTVIIYFIVIHYGCFIPALIQAAHIPLYCVTSFFVLGLILTMFIATTLDPADYAVRAKGGNKHVPQLDRTKNKHVIENQSCALCQVTVGPKSKHCSACNKCVSGFDHHCKWLNNCVGDRNYNWFFATLVFAILSSSIVICIGLLIFIAYFTDKKTGSILLAYPDLNTSNSAASLLMFSWPVDDGVYLFIDILTVILAFIAFGFLVHLTQFHIWLIYKNISTYDFIMMQREKQIENEEGSLKEIAPSARQQAFKINKVTPSKNNSFEKTMTKSEEDLHIKQRMERGETPPPHTSPIRESKLHHQNSDSASHTVVKKMKRKKKKKLLSSPDQEMEIAAVDNPSMYYKNGQKQNESDDWSCQSPPRKNMPNSPSSDLLCNSEINENPKQHLYRPLPRLHKKSDEGESDEENEDLNMTHMFHLNSNAELNPDGSLKYVQGQRTLPLTPVPKRKWEPEVPPLDLTALRGSMESTNSYKPYTATVRSTDTYRFLSETKNHAPLKTLPELQHDSAF
ncbi:putative palmitoyltransferase zdhhc11 [Bulinus truncatus]|nr:putative palmitoyltransferase zdhhc11 [Bulinus truncatus]